MKNLIFNMRWLFFVVIFAMLIFLGVQTLDEDFTISLSVIIIGSVLLIGYVFIIPNSYRIDETSITIYYGLGLKTKAKWSELKTVEDHHSRKSLLPWLREYQIGYFKTKFLLWKTAIIPKNRKTTKLIEKYYEKNIEKYG